MNCTHCDSGLAASAMFCPQCGVRVAGSRPPSSDRTAPLTLEQTNWLRVNVFMAPLIALLAFGGVTALFSCFFGQFLDQPFVKLFAVAGGLLLLATSVALVLHVRNHWADLRMGVAQVRVGRLVKKWATSQSANATFYAEFEGFGRIILMHALYEPLVIGQVYEVTYSPHTRRGWSIEPSPAQS